MPAPDARSSFEETGTPLAAALMSPCALRARRFRGHGARSVSAFTLIELLVVLGIVFVLVALLLPTIGAALARGRRVQCANNLRQLALANSSYADDTGFYVAAAEDVHDANLHRWHGARQSATQPFDGRLGPLVSYLGGADRTMRDCAEFRSFKRHQPAANTFESSCGGYGYNDRGVGSQAYRSGYGAVASARGMPPDAIAAPVQTVMFTDTAFPQPYGPRPQYLIEYSFAESYRFVTGTPPIEGGTATPSIHFRHRGVANVAWCDGHVSTERLEIEGSPAFAAYRIGWFGPRDNSLFDPY